MNFLNENFLLDTKAAQELYHGYAKNMPIFDFHCHLNPKDILDDKKFENLTQIWLYGDHYKWRLMRQFGIEEDYITGNKPDYEKFEKFAEMIPYCIGNPVYIWTHLELKRFFGIDDLLSKQTAKKIYDFAGEKLKSVSARSLIKNSNVKALCTTDDPSDCLIEHKTLAREFSVKVLPTFRPDKYLNIDLPIFFDWLPKLEKAVGFTIDCLDKLLKALSNRMEYFSSVGCICSDHALDVVEFEKSTKEEVSAIFENALKREKLSKLEIAKYKGFLLIFCGKLYQKHNFVQQYHIGAMRNNNSKMFTTLGADTGFDAIEDQIFAKKLSAILDRLNNDDKLPKTILYCLNPCDNEVLATIANCFAPQIQFGSAWWFNDQYDGMNRQLETVAQFGLLSKFVGMLTDSRSFLSYPRHEFFRRILCQKLGKWTENGLYANDVPFVGKIVQDICYNNAVEFFGDIL